MGLDWNNAAEQTIGTALGMVPEVGSILSALVYVFWPQPSEDVWGGIVQQVEQLMQQQLSQFLSQQVTEDLTGLQNALNDYSAALKAGDNDRIREQWIATDTAFDTAQPHFQSNGYEALLLPLFAQFANLELALLRDGVLFGASWGWTPTDVSSYSQKLTANIASFTNYAFQTFQSSVPRSYSANTYNEPFATENPFIRQMTLTATDFAQMWKYFDPSAYPNPVNVYLSREIYSDPVGIYTYGLQNAYWPFGAAGEIQQAPTQPAQQISVWASDRVYSLQMTYPPGSAPRGAKAGRMGDLGQGPGSPVTINILSDNPIIAVTTSASKCLNALTFAFQDGTSTQTLGTPSDGTLSTWSYPGEILSSVYFDGGQSEFGVYGLPTYAAVFGFQYAQSQQPNTGALRTFYVTSPLDPSPPTLAARCVVQSVSPDDLAQIAVNEGWESQRQAYQRALAAQSK